MYLLEFKIMFIYRTYYSANFEEIFYKSYSAQRHHATSRWMMVKRKGMQTEKLLVDMIYNYTQ